MLIDKSTDDFLEHVRRWYQESKDQSKDWRNEAKMNYDFYAGRQWTVEEEADFEEDLREAVTFNRIGPLAVIGYQINNRQESRFMPRQIGDVNVSEVLTGAAAWVEDESNTQEEEEDLFSDLLITGMGWSECRMSYDENLDGQLIPGQRFSPIEAYWDPNARRRNLADSKYRMRGRWMDRSDAESRWPELKKHEFVNDEFMWHEDEAQDEPHNAARAHFYENDARQWYNRHRDQVFILQVQWWDYEVVHRVGDPTGRILTFNNARWSKISEYVMERGLPHVQQNKKKYYQAFIAGPTVLERDVAPWPDGFTLQCCTGKRDAQSGDWFGIVRSLVDPQKWSNKFLSDLQDMIVSNRQGGAFVEYGALVDQRQAEENWNTSNPMILVNDGALSRGAIQERNPPQLPPALDRMIEWCVSAIPAVSGINQEFMGYAERDQPNVLEISRKRSAMNVLAGMFSSLRAYRKDRSRAVLYFIREYMNDGRLIRVMGGEGLDQYIPLALDPSVEEYDIIIDEASSSPNQKEDTFSVLLALLPFLTQSGMAPPVEALDYLPLPASFIAKWKESMQPKPPGPQEQMMAQAAQAEIGKDHSDAQLNAARARKEMAEAEAQELENQAVKLGIVAIEDV